MYQYLGVPWDATEDLFLNFEYMTSGPFDRLLTVYLQKTKIATHITHRLEESWPINRTKV